MKLKNITINLFVRKKDMLKIDKVFTDLIIKNKKFIKDCYVIIQNVERIEKENRR